MEFQCRSCFVLLVNSWLFLPDLASPQCEVWSPNTLISPTRLHCVLILVIPEQTEIRDKPLVVSAFAMQALCWNTVCFVRPSPALCCSHRVNIPRNFISFAHADVSLALVALKEVRSQVGLPSLGRLSTHDDPPPQPHIISTSLASFVISLSSTKRISRTKLGDDSQETRIVWSRLYHPEKSLERQRCRDQQVSQWELYWIGLLLTSESRSQQAVLLVLF